jgi:hypothetical protein
MCLGAGSPGWIDEALRRMSPKPVKADRQALREMRSMRHLFVAKWRVRHGAHMQHLNSIFALSPSIRYIAIYADGKIEMGQRDGIENASSSESDKYEELFINPTLLKLAKQRGDLDCGGARFVIVGYGSFNQLVIDQPNGHASICFQHGENPILYVDKIIQLLN